MTRFTTLLFVPFLALAQEKESKEKDPMEQIPWEYGPTVSKVGSQGEIKVPKGYRFAGAAGAKKFLTLTRNIPGGRELGILEPTKGRWFVIFEFDPSGYVKDEEKSKLDPAAMLASLREGQQRGNEERRNRGLDTLTITGWVQPPHYDETTHNLEWSLHVDASDGGSSVNHSTRYLGRRGVMEVGLILGPGDLEAAMPAFREVMSGFNYTPDNRYSAFVEGDKVAEYGLTALIVGGAAAAASKKGLFKGLWKIIGFGVVALGGLIKKIFARKEPEPEAERA